MCSSDLGSTVLITRDGTGITRTSAPDRWTGRSLADRPVVRRVIRGERGPFEIESLDGIALFGAAASVPVAGWYVIAGLERGSVLGPVERAQQVAWTLFACTVLLALGLGLLVARRIVPFVQQGQTVAAGDRIGMIRFGSRVDVYLPEGGRPLVAEGQTALAGETILAD